jgi:hypothetical protein
MVVWRSPSSLFKPLCPIVHYAPFPSWTSSSPLKIEKIPKARSRNMNKDVSRGAMDNTSRIDELPSVGLA